MFNGIKYILFGYSTDDQTTETNSNSINSTEQQTSIQVSKESSVFEQTLNAATTKLTEQLLPRCPSIEQLQSSSHQLLPTLNEQHEEDEFKRRKLNEFVEAGNNNDAEDDEDGFNADSWELLDLVEKQPESSKLVTGDQDVQLQDDCSKTSGILKSNRNPTTSSSNQQNNEPVVETQKRQNKPKVSFETPDLVKETKEKIERITPKENVKSYDNQKQKLQVDVAKPARKGLAQKKKALNQIKTKTDSNIDQEAVDLFCCELFPEIVTDKNIEKLVETKEKVEVNQLEAREIIKPQPVLNYAAALSMKLKKSNDEESGRKIEKNVSDEYSDKLKATSSSKVESSLQARGAVKRNRPVSFSSSCYEIDDDDCEIAWNNLGEPLLLQGPTRKEVALDCERKCKWQDDDNNSIISSGFSDCDYGYEGLNDIVMRPKKASGKKRRGLFGFHKATTISKRDLVSREVTKKAVGATGSSTPERKNSTGSDKDTSKHLFTIPSKSNVKSKKKKIVLSSSMSTSSYDFMKKRSPAEGEHSPASSGFKIVSSSSEMSQTKKSRSSTTYKPGLASHLMPPIQPFMATLTGSNTNSGNDSSDIADMDESWFVTPPPCFTGSNRFDRSKVPKFSKSKEADRENALIEHPSIYIASTSKQQQEITNEDIARNNKEFSEPNDNSALLSKQRPIVLRKVGKINNSSGLDIDNRGKSSSTASASSSTSSPPSSSFASKHKPKSHLKKEAKKAWENKFIVTNWDYDDEQGDVNEDFDNLFDESDKCVSSNVPCKIKKSKNKVPKKKKEEKEALKHPPSPYRNGSPDISPGYESDEFSIGTPALMDEIEDTGSDMPVGEAVPTSNSLVLISNNNTGDENLKPIAGEKQAADSNLGRTENTVASTSSEKRAPTQVRPIEPERKPGWQLRRKRSRRRPLSSSMSNACNLTAGGVKLTAIKPLSNKQMMLASSSDVSRSASRSGASNLSSSCSSPTLIDHMSSIVANLTSGFTATNNSLTFQARSTIDDECSDKSNQAAITLAHSEQSNIDAASRRRMSKSYFDRQNNCAKLGNVNRRADRRKKMHTTPNGYSINRKVHTNFH